MAEQQEPATQEFDAIAVVHGALQPLEPDARARVLMYIANLLGIADYIPGKRAARKGDSADESEEEEESEDKSGKSGGAASRNFGTFAELFDAADPHTQNDMALVASYWLQVSNVADSFTAQAASKELANLGHKLPNISRNLTDLKALKPAFVLQLKKSGTSKQARKTYKVSIAGIRRVEEMIGG
jgi:hypothetical protein